MRGSKDMLENPLKQKTVLRRISAVMVFFFGATSVLGDTRLYAQSLSVPSVRDLEGMADVLEPVQVPAELGSLKEYFQPAASGDQPFIFHIQDAHANPDAQEKIKSLLEWIHQAQRDGEAPKSLRVALEGSADTLHPEYLEFFPEYAQVNESIASDLLRKGELNGVELFAWESYKKNRSGAAAKETPLEIVGAEDAALYRENLKTYRALVFEQEDLSTMMAPVDTALELAKSKVFSPELRDFVRERQRRKFGDYDNGSSSPQLAAYLTYLASEVKKNLQIDLNERFEQVRFPNLVRLLVVGELDPTIDARRAREQKEKAIRDLTAAARTGQEKKLVSLFSSLDSGMPARRIIERAWEFAGARGVSLSGYGEYLKQLGSIVLRSEIDSAGLFDEVDILESWLIARLTGSEQERELIRVMDDIHLVEKLFQLKWTPSDYAKYKERTEEISVSLFGPRLGELAGKAVPLRRQDLEKAVGQALSFYEGARDRDRVLLDNALRNAPRSGATVLVTGGFHTEGLTRLMKERNIGYAVIQPRILKTDGGELYHKVLREETSDVSAYFEGNALDTQEAVFFKSLLEAGVPDLWEKYQVPHAQIGAKVAEAANRHPVLKEVLQAAAETNGSGSSVRFDLKTAQAPASIESQGIMVAARLQSNASFNREYAPVSVRRSVGAAQARRTATLDIRPAGTIIGTREGAAVTLPFDELRSFRDQVRKEIALSAFKAARGEDPSSSEAEALAGRVESFLSNARSLTGAVAIGPARDTFQSELNALGADLQQLKGMAAPQTVRAELRTSNLPENVEYIRQLLNPATREWPYDVEIISNTSEDERALREEELKAMTRGKIGPSGQPVRVISIIEKWNKVVEPGKGGAGNLLGTVNIYREVVSALSNAGDTLTIDDQGRYTLNGQVVKLRHILNGGRAKRMNGLNQTEHSSRGSTSVFGDLMYRVDDAGTTIDRRPLTLFALVAATHAPFGKSNDGTYIDDVYAGQVMVPSADVQNISGNGAAIVKFAQELKGSAVTLRNLTDLGVYEASPAGEIIESLPKGSFRSGGVVSVAAATAWLATHRGLYSLGSHRVSGRLLREISNFYDGVLTGPRDINREPPEFIKPMAILLKGMRDIPSAAAIINAMPTGAAVTDADVDRVFLLLPPLQADMTAAISAASSLPSAEAAKKAAAEEAKYREVVRIFLQYRNEIGPNWLGVYDFGSDSYWDRYRRPLEYANSNLILLSLFGTKVELNEKGELVDQTGAVVPAVAAATPLEEQQARDYAALRNITHPITNSWIGGIYIDDEGRDQLGTEVTFEDVKNGISIGAVDGIPGVFIKSSIIRNSEIIAGSSVTSSLVQNTSALIQAENSFVHGTLAKNIAARNSLVYNVVTGDDINEKGFSILGIQRPQLPAAHGHQIIVRQDFAYAGDRLHAVPFNDAKHGTNFAPGYADAELAGLTYEELNKMSEASSKDQNLGVRRTLWQSIQIPLGREKSELRAEEPEPVKPAPGLKPITNIPALLRAAAGVLRAKKILSPEEETQLLNTPDEFLKRRADVARFIFTVPLQKEKGAEVKAEAMTLPQLLAHFRGQPIPAAPAPLPVPNEKARFATRLAIGVIGGIVVGVSIFAGISSLISSGDKPVQEQPKPAAKAPVEPRPVVPPAHPLEAEYQKARTDNTKLPAMISRYIQGRGYVVVDEGWLRGIAPFYLSPTTPGTRVNVDRTFNDFEAEFNGALPALIKENKLRQIVPAAPVVEQPVAAVQDNTVRLTQSRNLAKAQAEYFTPRLGLVTVNFTDVSGKARTATVPLDHVDGATKALYSQPLAVSIWGKLLADMVEGDIPATVENPVQALEDLVDLRLAMLKEYKTPVWFQVHRTPAGFVVRRDPTRKTVGIEDINGDFGLTIPTIGALLGARELPANAANKAQINRIIEKHAALVKGFAPVYAKLYNPDRKLLAGELDVISGERVIARHKDRLVEDRAPIALAVAAGFVPPEAFTSVRLVTGTYRDRNGKEYTVLRPWDGGAFQEGYNGMYGVERLFGTMRTLRANTASAFVDLAERSRREKALISYFPGAVYIDGAYVPKAGHPDLKETGDRVESTVVVPANGLAFGDIGFVLDHYNTAVQPLALGNVAQAGLLSESYVHTPAGYRASPVKSAVIVGPSVIVLGNNGDLSNDALAALESRELGFPNALNILKGLYTPAGLGLTAEPVLAPGIPAGEGTPEAFTVPVVPPKGGEVKPVEKVVPPAAVPAADDLIAKATGVGIFTQVDSFPGNKAERSPNGVTIDYTLAGANRLTGAFLKFDNLDLTGVPTLTVQIGEKPAEKLPAKINVVVKVPGQSYPLKLKGQVLPVAADVKAGAKIEFDLPKLAGKVQEITIEIDARSVGANTTGSFSVTGIIPAKAVGVVPPKAPAADPAKKTVGLFTVELPADVFPFEIDKNLTNKNAVAQRDKVNPIIRATRDGIKARFPEESKKNVDSEEYVKAVVDFFHLRDKSNYKPGEDGYTPPFEMNDVRNFALYVKNTRGDRSDRELILIRYVMARWLIRELAEGYGVNITGTKGKVVTQADVSFFADRLAPLLRGEPVGDYGRSLKIFIDREFRDKATRVPPKPPAPVVEPKKPELRVEDQIPAEAFDLAAGPELRGELRAINSRSGIPHSLTEGPLAVAALELEYRKAAINPEDVYEVSVVAQVDRQPRAITIPVPRNENDQVIQEYLRSRIFNVLVTTGPSAIQVFGPAALRGILEAVRTSLLENPKTYAIVPLMLKNMYDIPAATPFSIEVLIDQPLPSIPAAEEAVSPGELGQRLASIQKIKGLAVGFDVGGTDAKIVVMDETSTQPVVQKIYEWETKPADLTDASEFPGVFVKLIQFTVTALNVLRAEGQEELKARARVLLDQPDAKLADLETFIADSRKAGILLQSPTSVGISFPDVIANNQVVGGLTSKTAALRKKYDPAGGDTPGYRAEFNEHIRPLARKIGEGLQQVYGLKNAVPSAVINDGNVGSLWAAVVLQQGSVFNIAGGTSLGGGYVSANGDFPTRLYELGYLSVFLGDTGHKHRTYDIFGTGQQLFTQDAVFELAIQKALKIDGQILTAYPKGREAETLRRIQAMFDEDATPAEERQKIREIFETVGEYLAIIVATSAAGMLTDRLNKVVLFGRPVSASTGQIVMDRAREVLRDFENLRGLELKRASEVAKEAGLPDNIVKSADKLAQAVGTIYVGNAERIRVTEDLQQKLARAVQVYIATPTSENYEAVYEILEPLAGIYGPQTFFDALRVQLLRTEGDYSKQYILRYTITATGQIQSNLNPTPVRSGITELITQTIAAVRSTYAGLIQLPSDEPFYRENSRENYIGALGVKAVSEILPQVQAAVTAKQILESLADLADIIDAHRTLTTSPTGTAYEARRAAQALQELPDIFTSFSQYAGIVAASTSASVDFGTALDLADLHERIRIQILPSMGLVLADHAEFQRFVALMDRALKDIEAERNELRTQLVEGDRVELNAEESIRLQIRVSQISRRTGEVTLQLTAIGQPVEIYRNRDNLTTPELTLQAGQTVPLVLAERDAVYLNAERETSLRLSEIDQIENEPVAVLETLSGEIRRLDNGTRNELRELAPELPSVTETETEVTRQIREILFPAVTAVPEVSTAGTIQRIQPVVQAEAAVRKRVSVAAREVARDVSQTIYEKAEDLSRQLGIGVDEALAVVIDELLEQDISDQAKFNLAIRAFEEEFGPVLGAATVRTGIQPFLFAPRILDLKELRREENQLLVAFATIQAPQDEVIIYYASPDAEQETAAKEMAGILDEIKGRVIKLGGATGEIIRDGNSLSFKNLKFRVLDPALDADAQRRAIQKEVTKAEGAITPYQPVVLDQSEQFLQSFGMAIRTGAGRYLGRVLLKREVSLSQALLLLPAVPLGQEVVDMLLALESKGFSREDISNRLTRFAQALQKIASAA